LLFAGLFTLSALGLFVSGCSPNLVTPVLEPTVDQTIENATSTVPTPTRPIPTIALLVYTPTATQILSATPTPGRVINTQISGEIELWHPYHTGSLEKAALDKVVKDAGAVFPNLKLNVLEVPASEIGRDYQIDYVAGRGPDLVIMNNDPLGNMARSGFIEPMNPETLETLDQFIPQTIEGLIVDGSLYGVPKSYSSVILYYRKSMMETVPGTTDELLQMVGGGKSFVTVLSSYHLFGWAGAFGGELLDENMRCIADQSGWVEALNYLVELKSAGALFVEDYQAAEQMFLNGEMAMLVNGSWELNKYIEAFGDDLGAIILPHGPAAGAAPLIGVEGLFLNPNSQFKDTALEVARFITSPSSMKDFTDISNALPARTDIDSQNEYYLSLGRPPVNGMAIPAEEEFGNYWVPFGEMFENVLNGEVSSAEGVSRACNSMNSANGK
jgi:maltose-binding protein MalE